jgi:hypothetical protein
MTDWNIAVYTKENATRTTRSHAESGSKPSPIVDTVLSAIEGIKYGSVEITIHDSAVVQVERRERFRLQKEPRA